MSGPVLAPAAAASSSHPAQAEFVARHSFAVLVDDAPGVLARVIGLVSGRGYNIESLTVAGVDEAVGLSRITLVTTGTPMVIQQIKAQLERLVPVHRVVDLTATGPFVERELALVKLACRGEPRVEALRIADIFRARAIDTTTESFVFELTGSAGKLDAFVALMRALGPTEIARTGTAAMARGPAVLTAEREADSNPVEAAAG